MGTSTNCTSCPFDSYLYLNQCISCSKSSINCVACESVGNSFTCLGCRAGYYLDSDNQTCLQCGPNCKTCLGLNNCTECATTYFIAQDLTCQPCGMPNCLQCTDDSTCTRCSIGTFLSPNTSTCEPCMENCAKCSTQESCQ